MNVKYQITTFSLSLLLVLFSCDYKNSFQHKKEKKNTKIIFSPIQFNANHSKNATPYNRDSLGNRFNHIVGKFYFSDRKNVVEKYLDSTYVKIDKIPVEQSIGAYPSKLKVYVDSTQMCSYKWLNMSEKKLFRPTYIKNLTPTLQFLHKKGLNIIAVQEALDSIGNWSLIELTNLDFCGNGYGYIPIEPQEYVLALAPVYEGNYKTKIRYKIISKDTVLYSNVYTGNINYNQFYLKWKKGTPIEIKGSAVDIQSKEAQDFLKNGFFGSPIKIKIYEP